jgi:Flp pilus assembly protein TadG
MVLPVGRDERGQVMVFVLFTIIFLLVIGGLAVDLAWQYTVRSEIQRSMDAASLAAAAKLGFNDTPFPTVRQFARDFALKNPYHVGTITLELNGNTGPGPTDYVDMNAQAAPYGDVILGVWDGTKPAGIGDGYRFKPSTNGSMVNAVMTRYKTTLQTSLLRMWGMTSLPMSAISIATSDPPSVPPPTACTAPFGLSMCPFSSNNIFTANGCGVVVKFTTSSGNADSGNTGAWADLNGGGTSASNIKTQVDNLATSCNPAPAVGTQVGSNGGQINSAFDSLETVFKTKFDASAAAIAGGAPPYTVLRQDGSTVYTGPGWELYVPVLGPTSDVVSDMCNADGSTSQINGTLKIVGWTKFVMTQMWDSTGSNPSKNETWNAANHSCVANNSADSATWSYCTSASPPSPLNSGNSRSMWGYYTCAIWDAPTVVAPAPRVSLGEKLRVRQ